MPDGIESWRNPSVFENTSAVNAGDAPLGTVGDVVGEVVCGEAPLQETTAATMKEYATRQYCLAVRIAPSSELLLDGVENTVDELRRFLAAECFRQLERLIDHDVSRRFAVKKFSNGHAKNQTIQGGHP